MNSENGKCHLTIALEEVFNMENNDILYEISSAEYIRSTKDLAYSKAKALGMYGVLNIYYNPQEEKLSNRFALFNNLEDAQIWESDIKESYKNSNIPHEVYFLY